MTQSSGPSLSCSVCACLRASWLVLELRLPWLCTALAHQGPNNGFIRAEPLSVHCRCSTITPQARLAVARAFLRPQASHPPSPQWPNHEVGLVPARLWAWSPLMGWSWPRDPGWGALLGPGALQGLALAGVSPWGRAVLEGLHLQWGYCRRGDGRYRTWVEGVVMVGGKHTVLTLLVHPIFGGRALPWGILLVHPEPSGRTLSGPSQIS